MQIEELNESLEYLGVFQVIVVAIMCFSWSFAGIHIASNIFITGKQEYQCSDKISSYNNSNSSLVKYHFENATNFSTSLYQVPLNSCRSDQCSNWSFSNEEFSSTMVSDYLLICEREYLAPLSVSLFFAGTAVGSPLFGYISDRFGRVRSCIIGVVLTTLISVIGVWREILNIYMFNVGRFLVGLTIAWSHVSTYLHAVFCTEVSQMFLHCEWHSDHYRCWSKS